MGLFDGITDIDFTEVEEFQLGLPAGVYETVIANVGIENKDSGVYMVITYTVTEGKFTGKSFREQQNIPPARGRSEAEEIAARAIKTRLLSLGIAEDKINTFDPEDLQGKAVALTLGDNPKNPQFRRVNRTVLLDSGNNVPSLPGSNSAATVSATKKDNPYS